MTIDKEYDESASREAAVDVDALLDAISEITHAEIVRHGSGEVRVGGHDYHSLAELASAFELDIHDYSVSEYNQ